MENKRGEIMKAIFTVVVFSWMVLSMFMELPSYIEHQQAVIDARITMLTAIAE